jgi:hypothetical protein
VKSGARYARVHSVCVRGGLGYGGGGASCKRIHIVFFFVKSTASLPVGVYLDPGSKNEQIKNDVVLHSHIFISS